MDDEQLQVEAAELTLHASGPMPSGAGEHLAHVVNSARRRKRRQSGARPPFKLVGREEMDAITDPLVASAMAQAEEEIANLDKKFAREEDQLRAAPPSTPDETAKQLIDIKKRLGEIVRGAARDGVRLSVRTRSER
jgi:hypothetical protein